jgi:hypothetical protein
VKFRTSEFTRSLPESSEVNEIETRKLSNSTDIKKQSNKMMMKYLITTLIVITLVASIYATTKNPDSGLVHHFVAFRFNETIVTPSQKRQVMDTYLALKNKCVDADGNPYIVSFDGGFPNSKEGFQQGMEQSYIVTFKNVADRDYFVGRPFHYPYDPAHDAFKTYVGPLLRQPINEGLIVIDFSVLDQP